MDHNHQISLCHSIWAHGSPNSPQTIHSIIFTKILHRSNKDKLCLYSQSIKAKVKFVLVGFSTNRQAKQTQFAATKQNSNIYQK
ncbi:hypothetical protein HYC85_006375 [Camellia sinensis]|uniref:Uncharacterized protein n=1 Tax=Camellia sinensis TaxID=4442 RepID=A0A7J7HLD3_CAMSI|nr:hypothetical protein HYC85_006375 [Camellia sinensis]